MISFSALLYVIVFWSIISTTVCWNYFLVFQIFSFFKPGVSFSCVFQPTGGGTTRLLISFPESVWRYDHYMTMWSDSLIMNNETITGQHLLQEHLKFETCTVWLITNQSVCLNLHLKCSSRWEIVLLYGWQLASSFGFVFILFDGQWSDQDWDLDKYLISIFGIILLLFHHFLDNFMIIRFVVKNLKYVSVHWGQFTRSKRLNALITRLDKP